MLMVGFEVKLLKELRVHHSNDVVQRTVIIRYHGEQRGFLLSKGGQVKLVMADYGCNLWKVELFQADAE